MAEGSKEIRVKNQTEDTKYIYTIIHALLITNGICAMDPTM